MKQKKDIGCLAIIVAMVAFFYGVKLANLTFLPHYLIVTYIVVSVLGIVLVVILNHKRELPLYLFVVLILLFPMLVSVYPNYWFSSSHNQRQAIVTDKYSFNRMKSIGHSVQLRFIDNNELFDYENFSIYETVSIGDTCIVEWNEGILWLFVSRVDKKQ